MGTGVGDSKRGIIYIHLTIDKKIRFRMLLTRISVDGCINTVPNIPQVR